MISLLLRSYHLKTRLFNAWCKALNSEMLGSRSVVVPEAE